MELHFAHFVTPQSIVTLINIQTMDILSIKNITKIPWPLKGMDEYIVTNFYYYCFKMLRLYGELI